MMRLREGTWLVQVAQLVSAHQHWSAGEAEGPSIQKAAEGPPVLQGRLRDPFRAPSLVLQNFSSNYSRN